MYIHTHYETVPVGSSTAPVATWRTLHYDDGHPVTLPEVLQLDRFAYGYADEDMRSVPVCRINTGRLVKTPQRCRETDDGAEPWDFPDGEAWSRYIDAGPVCEWLMLDTQDGTLRVGVLELGTDREGADVAAAVAEDPVMLPFLTPYFPLEAWPPPAWNALPLVILPERPITRHSDGGMTPAECLAGIPRADDEEDTGFAGAHRRLLAKLNGAEQHSHFPGGGAS